MVEVGDVVELPDGRIGEVLSVEGSPAFATVAVPEGDQVHNVGCAVEELRLEGPRDAQNAAQDDPSPSSDTQDPGADNLRLQGGNLGS